MDAARNELTSSMEAALHRCSRLAQRCPANRNDLLVGYVALPLTRYGVIQYFTGACLIDVQD